MKRILSIALLAAAAIGAQAQTDVMRVTDVTCMEREYKVANVASFDAADPMTITLTDGSTRQHIGVTSVQFDVLAALTNQYEFMSTTPAEACGIHDVTDLRAVNHYDVEAGKVGSVDYCLDSHVVLHVSSTSQLLGADIDGVHYACPAPEGFRLVKNRLNDNVSLMGDVTLEPTDPDLIYDGARLPRLRVNVTLDPVTTYAAANTVVLGSFQIPFTTQPVGSVLYKPALGIGGGSPTLVIGDAVATDAAGMRSGHSALVITLAGNRFKNGIVSLAETDSYTMVLYDYVTGRTSAITSHYSGIITTLADPEGGDNIYVNVQFTAEAGITYVAEYYGPVTTIASLDNIEPSIANLNNVIVTNADGRQTINSRISEVQLRENTDGTLTFFVVREGSNNVNDFMLTPAITIDKKLVNAGELSLPDTHDVWEVKYLDVSAEYARNEWVNHLNNGTLSVSNTDDTWEITVHYLNEYESPWGTTSGNHSVLDIHYSGPVTPYTGGR